MNKSEKFWNRIANQWDKKGNKLDQTSINAIENTKKHLNISDTVLDYACGIGTITNEIAANVKEIQAIDISSRMIDIAIKRSGERKIENIHYAQSTIFDERYKKESFNVIMAFNILHLLDDTQEVVQRINELLTPGGLFISATPCLGEKNAFLGIFLIPLSKIGIVPYVKMLKFSELESLIANGNFHIVETEHLQHSEPNYYIAAKKLK
jgi:2-polyprenyl-3-methyl-5-hydroxy-6-metoxy-1,4-benzoquinol methylase